MRSKTYHRVNKTPSFKNIILNRFQELEKDVFFIRKDLRKEASDIIAGNLSGALVTIDFALKEIQLFCELLVEKGIATQEEISMKRKKIKEETK